MGYQPDVPGPGEDAGPDEVPSEAANHPVPEGDVMDRVPALEQWQQSSNTLYWRSVEPNDSPEPSGTDILRRTGTHMVVSSGESECATEHRADGSAADLLREERLDPAQDDAGSQPD